MPFIGSIYGCKQFTSGIVCMNFELNGRQTLLGIRRGNYIGLQYNCKPDRFPIVCAAFYCLKLIAVNGVINEIPPLEHQSNLHGQQQTTKQSAGLPLCTTNRTNRPSLAAQLNLECPEKMYFDIYIYLYCFIIRDIFVWLLQRNEIEFSSEYHKPKSVDVNVLERKIQCVRCTEQHSNKSNKLSFPFFSLCLSIWYVNKILIIIIRYTFR